ncbi:hypothetical protein CRI94_08055 [Longibacter salinarum]|uniref:Peptidase S24/S26A/S26B/S26C domain-containing protein n=1 Tax=Longibacter salinarum TaxID=1850348 RepID=A0A2A8CZH0_9BACT|nr:S24 family peptidase [Longibacter salinarum]PEN13993.1 hypothetical protein CRI94_08055 [Longibacter salinarum]
MPVSTHKPPRPIAEVREETRTWLNHVCDEHFGGNVRRMATSLGYDDAGRSKLDRILKGKTIKIDSELLVDVKDFLREQDIEFLEPGSPYSDPDADQHNLSLTFCSIEVVRRNGTYVAERMEKGRYHVDPAEVNDTDVTGDDLFVIPVEGDSMDPEFRSGDRLIIQSVSTPDYQFIPGDGVYLYRLEESIQIKRLMRKPKRIVQVVPANAKYESYQIQTDDAEVDIEILGRVWARVKRY